MDKNEIKVGDQGYLRQFTGRYYIDAIKRPVTVIAVSNSRVLVQHAKLIFPVFQYNPETMSDYYKEFDGKRVSFYDTVAESIEPDLNGHIEELTWHPGKSFWGTPGSDKDYPEYLILGEGYKHFPYLD